ncbi:unnamed protein product [Pelagomonas calceolata]|uniref:Glutamine amidotransferase domain-containing protein n=1 Tax=Pelagomonas calceolata TaxID=35677 RepID=A0A7S4E2X8_9STRA|nr:unnamed protein product [Pelagomonas calceolata]|mmetsp:Transcript_14984/g.42522  ORF Transcript_14984/g.42522 Transcript_14984/m.42522 type:complete len:547 (-) Transcript_14984:13-1653(-)
MASQAAKPTVTVLDYGAGNVRSVINALELLGCDVDLVRTAKDVRAAEILVFPGVGCFAAAMDALDELGVLDALRDYLRDKDRPFLGICLGLQLLFASSEESPGREGVGAVDGVVKKLRPPQQVAIPHMGWNEALATKESPLFQPRERYYFVHSFAIDTCDPKWAAAVSDYGGQRFTCAVADGRRAACQFHPEKSGKQGLALLRRFVSLARSTQANLGAVVSGTTTLAPRIIAALDVRTNDQGDLVVTKGDGYDVREKTEGERAVRNLGKPVDLCARYYDEGADEICILNICAFKGEAAGDLPLLGVLRKASERCFVPLTIGGGVRDYTASDGSSVTALDVADAYFRAGADKVGIGSDAVKAAKGYYASTSQKTSIEQIATKYGRQAVVVSLDPRRVWLSDNEDAPSGENGAPAPLVVTHATARGPSGESRCWWRATTSGGRTDEPICAVAVAVAAAALGAGEFMVNCIDCDGKGTGYDIDLLKLVKQSVEVPVIASSGAGQPSHFSDVFKGAHVDAALAAGIFHRREVAISEVKAAVRGAGYPVRD